MDPIVRPEGQCSAIDADPTRRRGLPPADECVTAAALRLATALKFERPMPLALHAAARLSRSALASLMAVVALALLGPGVLPAAAQAPAVRAGSIRVTVRDATNLPIAGALIVAVDGGGTEHRGASNDRGIADLEGL